MALEPLYPFSRGLYRQLSVMIPSLIVATYGGGTGPGPRRASVLCGELSLGSAIIAEGWVEAHHLCGRNR
jgi:hydroxymethylglutaryl-CoA reductase (NADPH)